ncbi:type VI secretion system Vgr family protein [Salmonirosea aquatica]|uniref:Type VI secretion system tip protein VgrG n=1 Tax=Salmonirosea aquatica TaxID=2654236 RepID=A0A7C9FRE9_9BACT|nr:type VI secretion system tip protein VgrG [Cytophagaceae bacterium SJW1-29]
MIARVNITIGGTALDHFDNLSIAQPFDDHHTMDVRLNTGDLNEALGLDGAGSSVNLGRLTQDWAGQKITITISQGETDLAGILSPTADQVFEGLVTKISFQMRDSVNSSIVLTAKSPTILLEQGENSYSFTEMSLAGIVSQVLDSTGANYMVSPTNNPTIPYVTCYRESSYHFMQRLARKYGEWFWYDGLKIIFGKSGASNRGPIALEYGSTLLDMAYESRIVDLTSQSAQYDYSNDSTYHYAVADGDITAQNFAQTALQKSREVLHAENVDLTFQHYTDETSHEDSVKNGVRMDANRLVLLQGTSTLLGLSPGGKVTVDDAVQVNGVTLRTDNYGEFLLTKVVHYVDANGHYQNTFEAIPDDPDYPPTNYPKVVQPRAESQHAKVIDTNDPDAMGRVKVHLPWQFPADATTPWIRVANLMSGDETGVYFVPEVDEMVFVDFDFGDPDMPFVRGTFYHSNFRPGPKFFEPDNNFKGFITKGGNHILIDDTNGKENIRIYNKDSENELVMSLDGGSHIHIKSSGKIKMDADSIEMNAKNITVKAEEDFKLTSKNTIMESDYSTQIFAKNSTVGIGSETDSVAISSPTEIRVLSDSELKLEAMNITAEASVNLKAKGGVNAEIEGAAQATLKSSAMATVDGGAMTIVKGGMVMIN